jgi:DNA-binding CsgD family transcriptional regulator
MSEPAIQALVSRRLRIAVAASDAARRSQLVALVREIGHEVVENSEFADAFLTDGTAGRVIPTAAVAIDVADGEFAAVLPPDPTPIQVDAALRAVAAGLTVRAPRRQSRAFAPLHDESPVLLTPREIEVLVAVGKGLSNKAAARLLGISPHTVKFHVESLFRKLGAGSRAEAVAKGLKRQIVEI